jgi:hypothetical protein
MMQLSGRAGRCLLVLTVLAVFVPAQRISAQTPAQNKRIVIAASTVLDGKGHVLHNTRIVVEGSKIVALDPNSLWCKSRFASKNC